MSPALIIVHNHRFEETIQKLDRIYQHRFTKILHLVPFYLGDAQNVACVYENSFQFQAFFAQAYRQLAALECDHYIFAADDLILHPTLDEGNLIAGLALNATSAYIKAITHLAQVPFSWPYAVPVLARFVGDSGFAWERELPPPAVIQAAFERHGVLPGTMGIHNFKHGIRPKQLALLIYYLLLRLREQRQTSTIRLRDLPYPMVYAYSDFFILPRSALEQFCSYCSIFAAMNLFVEVAIPLALLLTCERIVCEADTVWKGKELWDSAGRNKLEKDNNLQVTKLLAGFGDHQLYIHPIKLSRWTVE